MPTGSPHAGWRSSPDWPIRSRRLDTTQEVERISSGVSLLDDALGTGLWPGASTLVAGPSGSGKTLIGLHFVFAGARSGQPGLIASFQENPTQLERIVQGFGWSLNDEGIHHMYRSTVDMYIDEWVHELLEEIERHPSSECSSTASATSVSRRWTR